MLSSLQNIGASIIGILLSLFSTIHTPRLQTQTQVVQSPIIATSTKSSLPTNLPTNTLSQKKPVKVSTVPLIPPQASTSAAILPNMPLAVASSSPLDFSQDIINNTQKALVNIICTVNNPQATVGPITGSGVMIDPRGVILTNAHVGQYLLLQYFTNPSLISCVIRTGSPATNAYSAIPLYISPAWIHQNANDITSSNPTGNGENDFALLLITQSHTQNPLPSSFPYIAPDTTEKDYSGNSVLVSGYAAGFLGGIYIQQSLYDATAVAKVDRSLTYSDGYNDYLDLSGTVVAQKGSSGGAVVDAQNKLIGLIATVTDNTSTGDRRLGAETLAHIDRSILAQSGIDLTSFLSGDITQKATQFDNLIAPSLTQTLVNAILHPNSSN
jgi:S1-C subfamily serine protease